MEISIGGQKPAPIEQPKRLSLLIWGPAGWGKTTLASSMPGRIALLNFDPDGPTSIPDATNVTPFDFSGMSLAALIPQLKNEDPMNIKAALEHFDSIVVDSITSISEKTLAHGIALPENKSASIENPGMKGYGARNNVLNHFISNMLRVTGAANKHLCLIGHEAAPDRDKDGNIVSYTMQLGGQLPQNVTIKINECWAVHDSTKEKTILIKKARLREPIKTRMFDTNGPSEFAWHWNTQNRDDPKNMRISDWYEAWKANGYKKIPLPKQKG